MEDGGDQVILVEIGEDQVILVEVGEDYLSWWRMVGGRAPAITLVLSFFFFF